eukprot:3656347-Prymnesium_polylepis.2
MRARLRAGAWRGARVCAAAVAAAAHGPEGLCLVARRLSARDAHHIPRGGGLAGPAPFLARQPFLARPPLGESLLSPPRAPVATGVPQAQGVRAARGVGRPAGAH